MSVLYAESSAVLAWLLGDPKGPEVKRALATARVVVTSTLTFAEIGRTFTRLVHGGTLTLSQCASADAVLASASPHWQTVEMTTEILERSANAFPVEPIRALAAIHIATAVVYSRVAGPVVMLSTDDRVRSNATALGMSLAL